MAVKATDTVKMGAQVISNASVIFSNLLKPDTKFGAQHDVTIEITKDLKKLFKEILAQTGAKKINGVSEYEGREQIKLKNKIYAQEGTERFPNIVDTQKQHTDQVPFGGDVINVIVRPRHYEDSVSIFLEKIQLVEKKNSGVDFEVIGGSNEDTEEDLPF